MSSSSEMMMRAVEKPPTFNSTCSMLYQFLKEKGSKLGDLNLDMQLSNANGHAEIFRQRAQQQQPIDFFADMENSRDVHAARGYKSMDLFPQRAGFGSSSLPRMSDIETMKKTVAEEPQKGQMTVFYEGKVHVFNDLPAEKAMEVMLFASKESSKCQQAVHVSDFHSQFGNVQVNSGTAPVPPPSSNHFPEFGQVMQQTEAIKPTPTRPLITDIPMQRKASLQRFLAKRKDRINNIAPYQMSSPGSSDLAKPAAGSKSWLGKVMVRIGSSADPVI
ncbi:protein TIFY 10a-like [Argentina anserina]|uniref:protein TIFY 10a-like n=1 Tax=Argentina anserina TaxID=57926 RepID=UPI002176792E|nr:protein TIFY 10a-like [Potentilla anserina]